ncbi:DUF1206 domain-containing protein [Rubrobacter xylanophilus]|uniref:DUF1206 domain-containing protein n=1 Tax=Rubrobacter xylanophilus TaxID=49319 RepID=UPI00031745F6|nr:DUF1206 domain-containing protein [Rubrobacter xylanophilus]
MAGETTGREAERRARRASRRAGPWIEGLARFGYAAEGVVYAVMGGLALGVATGTGGRTAGQQGVFALIAAQPLGRPMLGLVAAGFVGYALWRLVQAAADADGEGRDARGLARRAGYAFSALAYSALALGAGRSALGSGGGGRSARDWTAWLLAEPFGQALAVAAGLAILGFGSYEVYQAYRAEFARYLRLGEIGGRAGRWVVRLGRFGVAARGVVFGLVGGFLVLAAVQHDPEEARGLGGALHALIRQPFGPWLLGVVALGLAAYGLLMVLVARYRSISPG